MVQNDKLRQIDDFSEFYINAGTTIEDKIPVAGVDGSRTSPNSGPIRSWKGGLTPVTSSL